MSLRGKRLAVHSGMLAGLTIFAIGLGAVLNVSASPTGPISSNILGSGSDTTWFMMSNLDVLYNLSPGCNQIGTSQASAETQVYNFQCYQPDPAGTITTENYAHDQVHEANFLGSSNGIFQLDHQTTPGVSHIDFARSSRGPRGSDLTGLHFVAYALDAIIWEAWDRGSSASGINGMNNTSAGCNGSSFHYCLTPVQLYHIYGDCTITNWNQVGGNNVAMTKYTPQPGSGTRSTFEAFLAAAGGVASVNSANCPGVIQI